MGGDGDGGQPVLRGEAGNGLAQGGKVLPGGARARVDARPHLDLGLEELGRHLALQHLLAGRKQRLRHGAHQVAGCAVNEEVLLLDADCERGFLERHGGIVPRNPRRS
jgi:hypothetical protein